MNARAASAGRPAAPPADSASQPRLSANLAQAAVCGWLLHKAQFINGPHAGAVAGGIDAGGRAEYLYPEVTGYYLQWLAWRASRGGSAAGLADRAEAAQHWLQSWLEAGDPPATRIHLAAAEKDWRNEALFCFDLAMVYRGLGAAARQGLIRPASCVSERLASLLSRLIGSDGMLEACVPHNAGARLPCRWSSRRGGFLAKAAAGILGAMPFLGESPRLREAAQASFSAGVEHARDHPHDDMHAFCYALEGVLSMPRHADAAAALAGLGRRFLEIVQCAAHAGRLPESSAEPGIDRLDIIAQALRIGSLLERYVPDLRPDQHVLDWLTDKLVSHIRADGSLPFSPQQPGARSNVWTALFADQALAWVQDRPLGQAPGDLTCIV